MLLLTVASDDAKDWELSYDGYFFLANISSCLTDSTLTVGTHVVFTRVFPPNAKSLYISFNKYKLVRMPNKWIH